MTLERADGGSPFVLACDHAGREIPRRLGTLGLADRELERHIAWDIGAAEVARGLSERLQAGLVLQTYSRLVVDCNRSTDHRDSMTTLSEHTHVPGNQEIAPYERTARIREVFDPYHEAVAGLLDQRARQQRPAVLICVHSFTPVFKGESRPWHIGLLYNRDRRVADLLHGALAIEDDLCVGDNEPYAISDESDYTVPVHGEQRGIPHIEVEIRNDLIAEPDGQALWADRLAHWLGFVWQDLESR